jgi:hypothetical protein
MGRLFLSISFVLITMPSASARGWRGIIPLHSTRADVERLLGKSSDECNCVYRTENEIVRVDYAKAPCEGSPRGWNVPAGTVLAFSVGTKNQKFADLHIDESKFSKTYDDASFAYYASPREGIQYTVEHEGDVRDVDYFASTTDLNLRCKCFPADDGSIFRGMAWDSFGRISMDNVLARLDNFTIQLLNSPASWKGRVITYSPLGVARTRAVAYSKRIRDWLFVKRKMDPRRLTVIDGGHRETFGELYLVPPGRLVPPPLPTVGQCVPKRVH